MSNPVERIRRELRCIQIAGFAERIRRELSRTPDDPDLRWALGELEKAGLDPGSKRFAIASRSPGIRIDSRSASWIERRN